jgi:L-alanine-DL-glutamate epimerase-like enolase superfamily enzyme
MLRAFRIASVEATALTVPLTVPFGISGGAQPAAANVLVRLELAGGGVGYGEAAPLPPYNGETQEQALAVLQGARSWLEGWEEARGWEALAAEFRRRGGAACGSAQCAFETALLDALCRRENLSLCRYFGGAGHRLEIDMTVTTGSVAEAAASAKAIRDRGIRFIKVKIGGPAGPAHDLARLEVIREAAPEAPLILDGNAGVSRAEASALVAGLKTRGIAPAVLEQWLAKDDLDGARALARESGWPVAADESVTTAAEARRVAEAGAAQLVNIKLMKAGVAEARAIAAVARETGLGLMIGGNVETILAMTASASFAAGLGGFQYSDLDTPLFMAENPFRGGFVLEGGRLTLDPDAPGHGVEPKEARAR